MDLLLYEWNIFDQHGLEIELEALSHENEEHLASARVRLAVI